MNILISNNWLKEHLETNAKPLEIQKYLSLSGPSVEHIYEQKLSDGKIDQLFDIEVTTNRVDMMSIRGIAREAATILKRAGYTAELKKFPLEKIKKHPQLNLPLPEIIYETEAVNRVLAVVLTKIKDRPSPQKIQDRLTGIEINAHSALVDVTNYITHELGHPCHAFDYDKIMAHGGKIIIKEAGVGQEFVTLDGVEHQTVGGEIVFEDIKGEIIDLPAIKGTANTAVSDDTESVLLWIESLDAKKVRFASMSHSIRTVAAQLNEKNVDPYLALDVMQYGVKLISKLTGAMIASDLYDYFPNKKKPKKVTVEMEQIRRYLGIEITQQEVKTILQDLGCQVEIEKATEKIIVLPATYRSDIGIPVDVIEEIARIYGYHNLPSKLMDTAIPLEKPKDSDFNLESKIKHFLADIGWQEIYSYSLISEEEALQSGYQLKEHLKLANPLKEETTYLRRSLIPSLLSIFKSNQQEKSLSLFELANVYHPKKADLPQQDMTLAMLSNRDYRSIKGDLMALLDKLYLFAAADCRLQFKEKLNNEIKSPIKKQVAQLIILKNKKKIKLGELAILKSGMTAIEIDFLTLSKLSRRYPQYQAVSHQAEIIEQMTFTLDKNVAVGDLIADLLAISERIKAVELLDIYRENFTFNFIFQDKKVNISSSDALPLRQKIVELAETNYRAKLVGKI